MTSKNSIISDDGKSKKSKNKRKRKNKDQIKKLEEEFAKNPHWSNEDVDKISDRLNLDRSQVYKWNWDQKKKLNILPSKVYVVQLPEGFSQADEKANPKVDKVYVKSMQELLKLKSADSNNTSISKKPSK